MHHHGKVQRVAAEDVLTLIGYEQEKPLFHRAGIELVGNNQQPRVNEDTMKTNMPGIYVAGTALAGTQSSQYRLFLENCHQHVDRIVAQLTGETMKLDDRQWQQMIQEAPES